MDQEQEQFHADLLQSVREMKAGRAARVTRVEPTEASVARAKVGMSQFEFAGLLGVSVSTYQDWEQGRRKPSGAALTLLRVALKHPDAVKDIQATA
ncbi:helix-turn-helix domain-containing protein [Paraburkholderia sediminicola]|uniref:helix-turn-helix domain-containing protein n=1 Tax=Paraburkholderia sediminicola TaxID=458836 RepID=UPI0038BD367F